MNRTITHIEISKPKGKNLEKEPEKQKKAFKAQNPLTHEVVEEKTYTHEEVFSELRKKLKEHYGIK